MKKKVLFLLIPMLLAGLTGCVKYNGQGKSSSKEKITPSSAVDPASYSIEPSTPPAPHGGGEQGDPVQPETDVTVYLVFGENGLYNGQPVITNNAKLFLEHVVELSGKSGADLPGKDAVTSTVSKSTFVAWVAYNNDGKLTEYTKFPSVDKKILYATFTGGEGGDHSGSGSGGSGGGETPQPSEYKPSDMGTLPTEGFGFVFSDGSFMAGTKTDPFGDYQQYVITKRSFKQGQMFSLYDFANSAGWTVAIDEYSFGGNGADYLSIDTANQKYVVLKDFNVESIYLKFKMGADQVYFELAH